MTKNFIAIDLREVDGIGEKINDNIQKVLDTEFKEE
jgi:ERCC4-type nuclease